MEGFYKKKGGARTLLTKGKKRTDYFQAWTSFLGGRKQESFHLAASSFCGGRERIHVTN